MIKAATGAVRIWRQVCLWPVAVVRHFLMTDARRGQDDVQDGQNLGGLEGRWISKDWHFRFSSFSPLLLLLLESLSHRDWQKLRLVLLKFFSRERERSDWKWPFFWTSVCEETAQTDCLITFLCFLSLSFSKARALDRLHYFCDARAFRSRQSQSVQPKQKERKKNSRSKISAG